MTKIICSFYWLTHFDGSKWQTNFQIGSVRFLKYIEKKPNFTFLESLMVSFSLSTMVANIQPPFKKLSSYSYGAIGPKHDSLVVEKNHWVESTTCHYYKYILGSFWSELNGLFPEDGQINVSQGYILILWSKYVYIVVIIQN